MPAYTLHLLPETRTPGRPIVGGGTENCAVMAENAERLMRPRFAAIISLSLSSNERCRRRGNKGGVNKEKREEGDVGEMRMRHHVDSWVCGYCEPTSTVDWLCFVLRCD